MVLLGMGIILFPDIPLISIMFYSQVINGMLLPVILIFMLLLVNDRRVMGNYVNGWILNLVSYATIIVLIFLSGAMIFTSLT
jgi:Mn2+/Fe2+ NRAMP family transporter